MIITIDGPAGTGKSTVAKRVAAELGFEYLDTGAMYRMVGLYMLDKSVDLSDSNVITAQMEDVSLKFADGKALLCDDDVTRQLRTSDVTYAASKVAKIPAVRSRLVEQQQQMARDTNMVCEGRDQGTVVFPNAACKFFLTATAEERATRRMKELQKAGEAVDFAALLQEQQQRDDRDQNREVAPLKPAEDAEIVETSAMTIEEVVELLVNKVQAHPEFRPFK